MPKNKNILALSIIRKKFKDNSLKISKKALIYLSNKLEELARLISNKSGDLIKIKNKKTIKEEDIEFAYKKLKEEIMKK